jgi:hypothetical protein
MPDIVRAREPFSVPLPSGVPLPVSTGDLYYADDPIVKGRELLFGPVTIRTSAQYGKQPEPVDTETADATPGTRRAPAPRQRVDTVPKGEQEKPAAERPADPGAVGKVGAPAKQPVKPTGGKPNA